MKKKQNMAGLDRVVRGIIGTVFILLVLFAEIPVVVATVLVIIAAILLVTAISGVCLTYIPFRIDTRPKTSGSA